MDLDTFSALKADYMKKHVNHKEAAALAEIAKNERDDVYLDAIDTIRKDRSLIRYILQPGDIAHTRLGGPYFISQGGEYYRLPDDYADRIPEVQAAFETDKSRLGTEYARLAAKLADGFCSNLESAVKQGLLNTDKPELLLGLPLDLHVLAGYTSPETIITGHLNDARPTVAQIYRDALQPYISVGIVPDFTVEARQWDVRDYQLVATLTTGDASEA